MLRLLRAEKQHWPGPRITRGEMGPMAFLSTQAHPPLLFPQRLCQGHHSQVKRSSETSRGVTRAQTAQILFTKKKSPGLGVFSCHEL